MLCAHPRICTVGAHGTWTMPLHILYTVYACFQKVNEQLKKKRRLFRKSIMYRLLVYSIMSLVLSDGCCCPQKTGLFQHQVAIIEPQSALQIINSVWGIVCSACNQNITLHFDIKFHPELHHLVMQYKSEYCLIFWVAVDHIYLLDKVSISLRPFHIIVLLKLSICQSWTLKMSCFFTSWLILVFTVVPLYPLSAQFLSAAPLFWIQIPGL